jgi:diguanylate cyclase (GGDEF)-like protein/PAS domain S-box-containing protein
MYRVLSCVTTQHDWRLLVLAVVISLLGSGVAINIFHRATATAGRVRWAWLCLDAAAAGFGIWATHFIAMLAYNPGVPVAFDFGLTVLSLFLAVLMTGAGLALTLEGSGNGAAALGGAIVGAGVAVTHYTGMAALELPGHISWSGLVVPSIVLGIAFGSAAALAAGQPNPWIDSALATVLLATAILLTHFVGMAAVTVVPDPTRVVDALLLSPAALSLLIAAVATAILGMCLIAALFDRRSKERLGEQKVLLDTALENMSQGLCMFKADGRILLFNDRYAKMVGLPPRALVGASLLDVLKFLKATGAFTDDPAEMFARITADMREGVSRTRIVNAPGVRTLRIVEQAMPAGGWVSTVEDITDWLKAQAQIAHMVRHDALTDLPNRTLFREYLEQMLPRVDRDTLIAVLYLDLDHFKEVNDTLGHPVGDELLKAVAKRLAANVRESDMVCRLGGDEFAVVQLRPEADVSAASALASRLIEIVAAPYEVRGHQIVVGASIGISSSPGDGDDADQLLKNADLALYLAKAEGRGTYRFFEPQMDARAQARRSMEIDLRAALSGGEFELHYQPIYDLATDEIVCFEALLRWHHPREGMMLPATFIPLAEETGLIVAIGEWVLRQACMEAAGWSRKVRIAVNLSPVQFKSRNLFATICSALDESGLTASRLELEITETVLLQDAQGTLATLHQLRHFGIRISMDDFGTGYSSLSYLRSFPFDKIKIDGSFVRELTAHGDSMAIVRAVMASAQAWASRRPQRGSRRRSNSRCCARRAARKCKDISLARRDRQKTSRRCCPVLASAWSHQRKEAASRRASCRSG